TTVSPLSSTKLWCGMVIDSSVGKAARVAGAAFLAAPAAGASAAQATAQSSSSRVIPGRPLARGGRTVTAAAAAPQLPYDPASAPHWSGRASYQNGCTTPEYLKVMGLPWRSRARPAATR